jgi:hypothetical protein
MSTFISEPGTRLGGRYRLEDRLAAAAGWSAWKAIDEILARPVSVITFASGFPRLEQVVTAARAASRLTDTRLTQVFDVEDSWDHPYIVLEWPVGDTLADMLAGESIEPAAGARIVAEASSAIAAAHAAGLAHLCLQPEAVRWTASGGVKVTGLGIDAALAGITADDPELTDTIGLGSLLYAALTGMWPGADHPDLPPAPMSDGRPRRPRQVRAGLPSSLDDITSRALGLGSQNDVPFTSPTELAAALAAVIPPVPIPPAAVPRRDQRYDQRRYDSGATRSLNGQRDRDYRPPAFGRGADTGRGAGAGRGARTGRGGSAGRVAVATIVAVAVVIGLSAAALHFLHERTPAHSGSGKSGTSPSHRTGPQGVTVLTPQTANGFDAYHGPALDPLDENNSMAANVLDGNQAGWQTEQYVGSPYFGNLKPGSGLILNMGKPVTITSVTIEFGAVPGANVELKEGNSDVRSAANEQSMVTVAARNGVSGSETFTITKPVTDQYLVVWFTKLPPLAHTHGKYMAQIFNIVIRGTG